MGRASQGRTRIVARKAVRRAHRRVSAPRRSTTRRSTSWKRALLTADVGVDATQHLLEDLRARYRRAGADADPRALLRAAFADLVRPLETQLDIGRERPFVIMLAGVNGAGKTTSIGKLAKWLQQRNLSVLLAAGDTFRAAAREQLVGMGRAQRRRGDPASRRRSGCRDVRRRQRRQGRGNRRRARRHGGPAADAGQSDGRAAQDQAGARPRRATARRTRSARAGREHRAERAGASAGVRRAPLG